MKRRMNRIEISLSDEYSKKATTRAKKTGRSRKAELENIIRVELDKKE